MQAIAAMGVTPTGGGGGIPSGSPLVDNVVFYTSPGETAGYNAFGYAYMTNNYWVLNGFKKSDNHVAEGDFAIAYSLDGGVTSTLTTVKTGAGDVQTSQGTFYVDNVSGYMYALTIQAANNPSGFKLIDCYRILITDWQTDPAGALWTSVGQLDIAGYDNTLVVGDLWGDVIKLPSGKIRVPVHLKNDSINRHVAKWIDSSDDGATWSWGNNILDRTATGAFPNNPFSEINPIITHVGGTDATTKVVIRLRNEAPTTVFWTHVKSPDGGDTCTVDTTNAYGYEFDATPPIPISGRLSPTSGNVIDVTGTRQTISGSNHFDIEWCEYDPDDVYNNPNPKTSAVLHDDFLTGTDIYCNVTGNIEIHFGYPMTFINQFDGSMWIHFYDVHYPDTDWLGGVIKTRIRQKKITT